MSKQKLWIRVDVDTPRDPRIVSLALSLGTSTGQMLGHCVCVWLAVAEHCADGDMSLITPGTIEHWAQWTGPEGFGDAFLATFVQDGVLQAFRERNAKLAEQREKEREKKRRQRAGHAGDNKGTQQMSPSTERNVTEEHIPPKSPVPSGTFAAAWAAYPKSKNDNRRKAERAYRATVTKGAAPADVLAGVERYAAYLRVTTWRKPMLAATFFGPDAHWELPWEPDPQTGGRGERTLTREELQDLGLDPEKEADDARWIAERKAALGLVEVLQ